MKQLLIIFSIVNLMVGCKTEPYPSCIISGKVSNFEEKRLYLTMSEIADTIMIRDDGSFSKELNLQHPAYGSLKGGNLLLNLYLEPGKVLEFNFAGEDIENTIKFKGDLSLPNQYLLEKAKNGRKASARSFEFWRPPNFSEYKRILDSIRLEEVAFLDKFKLEHPTLSKHFYGWEKYSIDYQNYSELYRFPYAVNSRYKKDMQVPTNWFDFMSDVDFNNPTLLNIETVRWLHYYHVAFESIKKLNIITDESSGNSMFVRETFRMIKATFPDQKYYDVLCHYFLWDYVDRQKMGLAGIEDLLNEYLAKCKTKENKDHIQFLKNKWQLNAAGKPAPTFTIPDNKGNEVSLIDFKGKYILIDFWFSGCGPCRVDIPFLKQIIDDYRHRNIIFISISIDKQMSDWVKILKEGYILENKQVLFEDKANWIHLHDPKIRVVAQKFLIAGYPTYLLIDPKGCFVNANCERPSRQDKLRNLLESQPGL